MRNPIISVRFRSTLFVLLMAVIFFVSSNNNLLAGETTPKALVIGAVDVEGTSLTIYGQNLNIGPQNPVVYLENELLPLTAETPTDEKIVADLSQFPHTDGYFLLSVSTGPNLEENDTHGLLLGEADQEPLWTQLHVQNNHVNLDEANDKITITIFGYNFDLGYSPEVYLGDTRLSVDESDETQIIATGNIPDPMPDYTIPEYLLLTLETGTSLEKYDVVLANIPEESDDLIDPPSEGQCYDDLGLCWKEGPRKPTWPVVCLLTFKWRVPKYYELTKDYEIDLADFYKAYEDDPDDPLLRLPRMATKPKYGREINDYFAQMKTLPDIPFNKHTDDGYKWDFISIEQRETGDYKGFPIIRIKKGYRWDGTTRPCRRFESEFRSGLVHDAMYDLIRIGSLPWKESYTGWGKNKNDRDAINNRELADILFFWISLQERKRLGDYTPDDPDLTYYTLQHDGMGRANRHIEEWARWRFHTLADGTVSTESVPMDIDADGNKSLSNPCACSDTEIEFDASLSRPITVAPKYEEHYKLDANEMHETTWQWYLDGVTVLVPMKQSYVNPGMQPLDLNELTATMTVEEMIHYGFVLGVENTVTLHIDKDKNPLASWKKYYEKKEDIKVTVNYDSESPVVTCPNNIIAECTEPEGASVEFEAVASDVCDGTLAPTCDPVSGTTFELGSTSIVQCQATDTCGKAGWCSFTVEVVDTTPPIINNISISPEKLWPPNGKMVPVKVSVSATDICDTAPVCTISSIVSNETIDGVVDSEITGNFTASLRSRRSGTGDGRTYTITAECRDAAGNSTIGTTFVTVPHDQGKNRNK